MIITGEFPDTTRSGTGTILSALRYPSTGALTTGVIAGGTLRPWLAGLAGLPRVSWWADRTAGPDWADWANWTRWACCATTRSLWSLWSWCSLRAATRALRSLRTNWPGSWRLDFKIRAVKNGRRRFRYVAVCYKVKST